MSNEELKLFDLAEVRKAIAVLYADVRWGDGECIEVRYFNKEKGITAVGWFDDPAVMARAVALLARDGVGSGYRSLHESVYWTANPVTDALLSRKQKNIIEVFSVASSDSTVTRRLWLPIDIDPIPRPRCICDGRRAEACSRRAEQNGREAGRVGHH